MTTWIGLLRAVNVGGRTLPMAELRAMVADLGGTDVRTYIQSGNVLFGADDGEAVARRTERAIAERYGYEAPVVVRTAAAVAEAVARSPFAGADPATLYLGFLSDTPDPARVAALPPDRSPPDRYEVIGRELHLCLPKGAGKSKVSVAWLDARLGVTVTIRNWRTVHTLIDLAG